MKDLFYEEEGITVPNYSPRVQVRSQAKPSLKNYTRNLNFGGENCMLNSSIVTSILLYEPSNFRKFLRLSPNWRFLVL